MYTKYYVVCLVCSLLACVVLAGSNLYTEIFGTPVESSFFNCLYLMSVLTLTCDLHFYELSYYMKLERYIN